MNKISVAMMAFLAILMLPAVGFSEVTIGVEANEFNMDEAFNFEHKQIEGLHIGVNKGGPLTAILSYTGGDFWAGSENVTAQMLKLDFQFDLMDTMLRPYTVFGVSHVEHDYHESRSVEDQTSTQASVGLGLKMDIGKRLFASADYRVMSEDIMGYDSAMATVRFGVKLGSIDDGKSMMVPSEEKVVKDVRVELKKDMIVVFFDHDSAALTEEARKAIGHYISHNDVMSIRVGGHTSRIGGEDYNMKLAEQRAVAVSELIHDVDSSLDPSVEVYGEEKATGNHRFDRRVVITADTKI